MNNRKEKKITDTTVSFEQRVMTKRNRIHVVHHTKIKTDRVTLKINGILKEETISPTTNKRCINI